MIACIAKPNRKHYLKIDMSIWEPVGTSFIEEVNVFDQEAEERNNNLEGKKGNIRLHNSYNWSKKEKEKSNQIEHPHWRPSESYLHSKIALGNIVLEQPLKACRAEHNWIYHFGGQ